VCTAGEDAEYSINVSPAARRDLKHLAKRLAHDQLERIDERIRALAKDPRPAGSEKLSQTDNIYRVRDGDYRIVYAIRDAVKQVELVRVRDRKDVYRP